MNSRDVSQIAAAAWNATRDSADPEFGSCSAVHRGKLETAVVAIEETGSAGIQGLEDFEEAVKAALKDDALVLAAPKAPLPAKPAAKAAKKEKK